MEKWGNVVGGGGEILVSQNKGSYGAGIVTVSRIAQYFS